MTEVEAKGFLEGAGLIVMAGDGELVGGDRFTSIEGVDVVETKF